MKTKIVSVVLAVLLIGLVVLPGCVSIQIDREERVSEIAKIEIIFNPNPVTCQYDRSCSWQVIIKEVNGVGVKINDLTIERYRDNLLIDIHNYDSFFIEEHLGLAYLPAYGSVDFEAGLSDRAIDYEIVTITGTDDNGHEITARSRVRFLFLIWV